MLFPPSVSLPKDRPLRVCLLTVWLTAAVIVGALTGCGAETDTAAPNAHDTVSDTTVTDALDRSVRLRRPVDRVVSLAPNLTEIVYAAGAGSTLVAVTTSDDFPPAVDTLPKVSSLPVNFEAIASQRPDLVLATDQINAPRDAGTFEALDLPIYFFSFTSLDDVLEAIRTTGRLLGTPTAAADSARALRDRLAALRNRTDALDDRPRVLVLIGDDTLYAFGRGSYVHTLVEIAGGVSVTASMDAQAPTLSDEYVLQQKPDVIVGAFGANYDPQRLLDLHPTWDVVPAVRDGRVYSLPPSLLLRPGPRLVHGATHMAEILHPDVFDDASSSTPTPNE